MHLNKSLPSLCLSLGLASLHSSAQTPTVITSTNYVAFGQSLTVAGSGFATNEYVNIFVEGKRAPDWAIRTDSQGSFRMCFSTNSGQFAPPGAVSYRFNPAVEAGAYYANVTYESTPIPWHADAPIWAFSPLTSGGTPLLEVRLTARVAGGGNAYDVFTSTTPMGPWHSIGTIRTNNAAEEAAMVWDFVVPQGPSGFFVIGKPQG